MTYAGDPYRILGLAPGASTDDVKRAYRRLAKQFHPDSAGGAATSRFLAVQAAYEALVASGGPGRSAGVGRRPPGPAAPGRRPSPGGRPAGTAGGATFRDAGAGGRGTGPGRGAPWQADADRARATHEAYRRRTGGTGDAHAGAADEAGRPDDAGRADEAAGRSNADDRAGTRGRGGAGDRDQSGPTGATRRTVRKARPGSTSYDEAERDATDPRWQGATWYGQSSGTYWTINPREYADPRKHGPEYQARARRAIEGSPGASPATAGSADGGAVDRPDGPSVTGPTDPSSRTAASPSGWADGTARGFGSPPTGRRDGSGSSAGAWTARAANAGTAAAEAATAGTSGPGAATAAGGGVGSAPQGVGSAGQGAGSAPAGHLPRIRPSRAVLALLGWPVLGLTAATLVGAITGCDRYAATCTAPLDLAGLAVQPLILAALLLAPTLAQAAAVGSLAVVVAAVPAAVALSAAGGSRAPGQASVALWVVLGLAFLAGMGLGVTGRVRLADRIEARLRRYDDRHGPTPLRH